MESGLFDDNLPLILTESTALLSYAELNHQIVSLYEQLGDGVYQYLVFLGLSPSLAEDQCQECFLELCKALHARKRIESPRKWLFSVAYRLAMDALSTEKRHTNRLECESDLFYQSDAGPSPEQTALQLEQHRRLHQAVSALSPQQRNCLHLRTEGLRHREIAEVLGINIKTVSEFLHRAVSNLRKSLR